MYQRGQRGVLGTTGTGRKHLLTCASHTISVNVDEAYKFFLSHVNPRIEFADVLLVQLMLSAIMAVTVEFRCPLAGKGTFISGFHLLSVL